MHAHPAMALERGGGATPCVAAANARTGVLHAAGRCSPDAVAPVTILWAPP